jgi:hypothetical protein
MEVGRLDIFGGWILVLLWSLDVGACGLESPARFFSLTPGFSPVTDTRESHQPFQRFLS